MAFMKPFLRTSFLGVYIRALFPPRRSGASKEKKQNPRLCAFLSCSQSSPHYREKGGIGPPACLLTQDNVMRGWRVGRTGLEKIMYNRRSNRGENEARRKMLRLFFCKKRLSANPTDELVRTKISQSPIMGHSFTIPCFNP